MTDINYAAVAIATLAGFIVSAVYYAILGNIRTKYSNAKASKPDIKQVLAELLRTAILVFVIAILTGLVPSTTIVDAVALASLLWLGFPVILLSGSVMYEKTAIPLALLHGGDWLIKLVVVTSIIVLWR